MKYVKYAIWFFILALVVDQRVENRRAAASNILGVSRIQLQPAVSDSKPTCNSSNRGTVWFTNSALGVVDVFEVCRKNVADIYGWASIAIP